NQVDALLNKSWDEILSAIGTRQNYENQIAMNRDTSAELKKMLEEVLSKSEIKVKTIAAPAAPASTEPKVEKKAGPVAAPIEPLDEVEEIEDIEEAETLDEVESLDEVEALDAPAAEAATSIISTKQTDDSPYEIEALDDAEPLEDAEDLGEAEELDEVEDLGEVEELDDAEVLDEIEEVPSEELDSVDIQELEVSTIRDEFFNEENSAFSTDEEFATVENVFAEELHFGESYIKDIHFAQDSELEATVSFDLSDPEFGNDEELIPVEETRNFYSMAEFGANNNNVSDLISDEDAEKTIVEKNGVFSISENLTIPRTGLDKDFKKLVDAVLR
ncbi:MAG: hypothetical protein MJ184_12220, partial [Treponema sp.]|nr:hypothetical protein [Treponema sp.]